MQNIDETDSILFRKTNLIQPYPSNLLWGCNYWRIVEIGPRTGLRLSFHLFCISRGHQRTRGRCRRRSPPDQLIGLIRKASTHAMWRCLTLLSIFRRLQSQPLFSHISGVEQLNILAEFHTSSIHGLLKFVRSFCENQSPGPRFWSNNFGLKTALEIIWATAKHVSWLSCAWLLLTFYPFPVSRPEHEHCTLDKKRKYIPHTLCTILLSLSLLSRTYFRE